MGSVRKAVSRKQYAEGRQEREKKRKDILSGLPSPPICTDVAGGDFGRKKRSLLVRRSRFSDAGGRSD